MLDQKVKNLISNLYQEYKNYRDVARLENFNHKTIRRIVQNLYVKDKKKPGQRQKLSTRQLSRTSRTALKLLANGQCVTAAKIQIECDLSDVCQDTIRAALHSFKMTYKEVKNPSC